MKPAKQTLGNGPIYAILIGFVALSWWLIIQAAMLIGESALDTIKQHTAAECRRAVIEHGARDGQK